MSEQYQHLDDLREQIAEMRNVALKFGFWGGKSKTLRDLVKSGLCSC